MKSRFSRFVAVAKPPGMTIDSLLFAVLVSGPVPVTLGMDHCSVETWQGA